MKITFKPLKDPAPVRPADMPEGVAFETTLKNTPREIILRIAKAGRMYTVARDGDTGDECGLRGSDCYGPVLSRRDGKPLPGPEPVPLDTLEPFPVCYRRGPGHTWWYQHDGVGGYTVYTEHTGEIEMHSGKGKNIDVSPAPYIMEVWP